MDGTVTISLKDYDELRNQETFVKDTKQALLKSAKELEVFLSFLCTRESITEYIDEFNTHAKTCKIRLIDGRAKIELLNAKQDESDQD
jgi:hypothetical protein